MATHTLNINALSFSLIHEGRKTLEVRLLRDGVEEYAPGDTVVVRNRETGETVNRTISKLNRYTSLQELLQSEDLSATGAFTDPDAFKDRLRGFHTEADERQFGLAAVHFA